MAGEASGAHGRPARRKYYDWARLLSRVFSADVLSCFRCGEGPMQHLCGVTRPDSVGKILASVGLPAYSPEPAPSRYPDQLGMFSAAAV